MGTRSAPPNLIALASADAEARRTQNALFLLATSRVQSSELCESISKLVDGIRSLGGGELSKFLSSSGLCAWRRLFESHTTQHPTWFSEGFQRWAGLTSEDCAAFLTRYLELKISSISNEAETLSPAFVARTRPLELQLQPTIRINDHIVIDASDPFLAVNFQGMETLERAYDPKIQSDLANTVIASLQNISLWSIEFSKLIEILVREIVPCRSPDSLSLPSGTCSITPSAIYVSTTTNADAIAELIVHETAHLLLSLQDRSTRLVDGISPEKSWDEEIWYSPWRDQPRSIMGVLHAIYAFSYVLDFHCFKFQNHPFDSEYITSRIATLGAQLGLAVSENKIFPFLSNSGKQIFEHLIHLQDRCETVVEKIRASRVKPRFAERHKEWSPYAYEDAFAAARSHHAWFRTKYSNMERK